MKRKMTVGGIYHICNKSIANYEIFGSPSNGQRFIETVDYYNRYPVWTSFSVALKQKNGYQYDNILFSKPDALIKILSYCIMPDHYHLLFKVMSEKVISKYISDVENSFTRYFNLKHNRKGPLWQSRYRAVHITSNEQLLHTSRYIHLNPTTNNLVKNPLEWRHSSYKDILDNQDVFKELTELSTQTQDGYKKFVEDNIDYQKSLKQVKKLLLD